MKRTLGLSVVAMALFVASPASAYLDTPKMGEPEGPGTAGIVQVGDIQHVANIAYGSGSDIEFGSYTVTKLSNGATGTPVCAPNGSGGCLVGPDGNIVFQTEVRDFAFVGRVSAAGHVIDITDPRAPVKVADLPCRLNQNDIQIQGNLLFQAEDGGGGSCTKPTGGNQGSVTTGIVDITNPRSPKFVSKITESLGAHNHTVHPTQPFIYLSNSELVGTPTSAVIHIWTFANQSAPTRVKNWQIRPGGSGHPPHDIAFNADGTRAYLASISTTDIIDTTDPANPVLISTIPNEGISISHGADPTPDEKFLVVADELGGGTVPGASPGGPLHLYDIRNEARPVKIGVFGVDCTVVSCDVGAPVHITTAHVGRINPDGYTMAVGWYQDGVHVIDYSDTQGANAAGSGAASGVGPRTIGMMKMPNANVWAAKMWQERHPGYVFANDLNRGFDVFHVSSMGSGFLATGTIRGGHPGVLLADAGVTRKNFETTCEFSPVSNGVDGWVTKVPAPYGNGTFNLTAKNMRPVGNAYDLDLHFYNKDCGLISSEEDAGDDETGKIPAGTVYAMATDRTGAYTKVNFYVGPA